MTESPTASCGSWSCSKEQNLGKGLKNDLDVGSIFPFFHPQKIPERNKWLGTATNVAPALETMVELSALASNPQDTCRLGEIFGVCVGNLGKNGRLGKHQDSCFGTLFWTNSKKVSIWFNIYIYIFNRNQQWHTFQPSSKPSCTLGLAIRTSQRDPTVRATYKQRAWTRRASQNGPRYFILESWPFQRWKTMSSWNRFEDEIES